MAWRCRGFASLLLATLCSASASAQVVVATGGGGGPIVRIVDSSGSGPILTPYMPGFPGGVRVALGDVNGDGNVDIITGPGPTGGPHVRVFSGTDLSELASFFAYDPSFGGGIFVAAGDVNGDGRADIITGAGAGGGPHVRVFSGADLSELASFFAYDPSFPGGVSVAAGDVNGDGRADIITGAGAGGGPHVRAFSGADLSELASFFAYDASFAGGVSVASLDYNSDGRADIVTGPGPGAGPHVRVFNAVNLAELAGFFAYHPQFPGGVSVAAGDFDRDGRPELVTGAGPGGGPHVIAFRVPELTVFGSFFAFDPLFTGGVAIGSLPGRGRSSTFAFNGAPQSFTVPAGVTSVTVEAWGGQGGRGFGGVPRFVTPGEGGLGGYVKATLTVTPGETLLVFVGGRGTDQPQGPGTGSNGSGSRSGGDGGSASGGGLGGGGGAASVVRQGSSEVIAGGGGGGGSAILFTMAGGTGGGGGGPLNGANGADGKNPPPEGAGGGQGGTAGGVGGSGGVAGMGGAAGANGSSDPDGNGGAAAVMSTAHGVGGGGGGAFGGGGAGGGTASSGAGGGGGGGSSHVPAGATSVAHQRGVRVGDGQVIISSSAGDATASPSHQACRNCRDLS